MARNQQTIKKRNEEINADYAEMFFKKMMRNDVIYKELGKKYYLEPSTIYKITIAKEKEPKKGDPNQLEIFSDEKNLSAIQ